MHKLYKRADPASAQIAHVKAETLKIEARRAEAWLWSVQ
jgi:hypothetical protein